MSAVGRFLRTVRAAAHAATGWLAYRFGWHEFARRRFERVLLLRGADFFAYVQLGRIAFDLGDYAGWRREFEHARRTDPDRFARLRHPLELFEPRLAGTQLDLPDGARGFDATGARATWRSLHPLANEESRRTTRRGGDLGLGADFDGLLASGDALDTDVRAGDARPGDWMAELRGGPAAPRRPDEPTPEGTPPKAVPPDGTRPEARLPDASLSHDDCGSAAERKRFRDRGPIAEIEIARCDLDELARRLSG